MSAGSPALDDLGFDSRATGSSALADFGSGSPAAGSLALADLGPGPPAVGFLVLADIGTMSRLSQRLILGILNSAHLAFGFDPGFLASASTADIGRGPLQDYTFTLITGNPRSQLLTSRSSIYALGLSLDSSPSLFESLLYTATFSGSFYTGSLMRLISYIMKTFQAINCAWVLFFAPML